MKRRDTLTALGFLAALALALAVVVSSCFGGEGALETLLKQALRDRDVQAVLDGAERAVNQDLDRDHFFIQLFGGVQRLSGRPGGGGRRGRKHGGKALDRGSELC